VYPAGVARVYPAGAGRRYPARVDRIRAGMKASLGRWQEVSQHRQLPNRWGGRVREGCGLGRGRGELGGLGWGWGGGAVTWRSWHEAAHRKATKDT
jgi:hypothetical protein